MDFLTFLALLIKNGTFATLINAAAAQFGPPQRPYLGATLLPERLVEENMYTESAIRYRTVIANDGTRYSPAQLKSGGELVGSFDVKLGEMDIKREFTGRDLDALIKLLGRNLSKEGALALIRWSDQVLLRALLDKEEKQRWEAIVNASVVRTGDNGYTETVAFPNPTGHRPTVAGTWSNDAYDPFDDIAAGADILTDKGYTLSRIVTSTRVMRILQRNDKMARRFGNVRVLSASDVVGRMNQDQLRGGFQANDLPAPEVYDATYRDQAGSARFFPTDAMALIATTGRDETVEVGEGVRYLPDTVGYTAIGRAVGQAAPGRVIYMQGHEDKPARIDGEAYQTSFPVVTEPESIVVLRGIN